MENALTAIWMLGIATHFLVFMCYMGPGARGYVERTSIIPRVGVLAAFATGLRCLVIGFASLLRLAIHVLQIEPIYSPANYVALAVMPILIAAACVTLWSFWIDYTRNRR
jgi:hypothetical protein